MSAVTLEAMQLMDVLPENDQNLALELIKRMVRAWDPDFVKLTQNERAELEAARLDDNIVMHNEIDWD